MSGPWMTAVDRFPGYRAGSGETLHRVSSQACRAVLREIARIANDAGVAHVWELQLVERTGWSRRQVSYALAQLQRDGWLWQARRGMGGRLAYSKPHPSIWVLRPLPTGQPDERLPSRDVVGRGVAAMHLSHRHLALSVETRRDISLTFRTAQNPYAKPVDKPLSKCDPSRTLHKKSKNKNRREGHLRLVPDELAESSG